VEMDEAGGIDLQLLSTAEGMLADAAGDDLLDRSAVESTLAEKFYSDGGDEADEEGDERDAERRQEKEALAQLKREAEAEVELSDEELSAEFGYMPPSPPLLYESVEAIFNHKNLWVSRTLLDPARLKFDLENDRYWLGFIEPRMANQGMPKAFYTPKRLGTKTPPDRLKSMEAQIEGELKTQLRLARSSGLLTVVNKSAELVETLKRGLELQEDLSRGDDKAKAELTSWRRDVQSRLPSGSTFKARAFHFAYTDAKKIRKSLLAQCNYADDTGDGTEFTLAVKVFGYHGGICSVWVFYGLIDTNLLG